MRAFEPRGACAVAIVDAEERAVLAKIFRDVAQLIVGDGADIDAPTDDADALLRALPDPSEQPEVPSDPAVLRVLPNAAPLDAEVAQEFRRLTESDLRALKVSRLRTMCEQLASGSDEWVIPESQALASAAALTDVRLVLASRLGIVTDEDATALHDEMDQAHAQLAASGGYGELSGPPERVWLGMLYQALTWLQESLMSYVMRDDV